MAVGSAQQHRRRYIAKSLRQALLKADLRVDRLSYFNTLFLQLATLAWIKERKKSSGTFIPGDFVKRTLFSIFLRRTPPASQVQPARWRVVAGDCPRRMTAVHWVHSKAAVFLVKAQAPVVTMPPSRRSQLAHDSPSAARSTMARSP